MPPARLGEHVFRARQKPVKTPLLDGIHRVFRSAQVRLKIFS